MGTASSHDIIERHEDVDTARARVTWLDDSAIERLGPRDPQIAIVLALVSGGVGHRYLGDRTRGGILLLAYVAALVTLSGVPMLGALAAIGTLAALDARARALRLGALRAARQRANDLAAPVHPTERLLAAAHAAQPTAFPQPHGVAVAAVEASPFALLVDRLRKLALLRHNGVVDAALYADRKLELLQSASPATQSELEDLLVVLVRLEKEGTITRHDVAFVRDLGVNA